MNAVMPHAFTDYMYFFITFMCFMVKHLPCPVCPYIPVKIQIPIRIKLFVC